MQVQAAWEALPGVPRQLHATQCAVLRCCLALPQFWRKHNPEAVGGVEAMGMAPGDAATAFVCQVSASSHVRRFSVGYGAHGGGAGRGLCGPSPAEPSLSAP